MTAIQGFSWSPPSSPDSPRYKELLAYVEELKRTDPKLAMATFAAVAEIDFWFWQWKVMSLGKLKIEDQGHKRYGKPWVLEKAFFDMMREVQEIFDQHISPSLVQAARGMFKSSAVQKGGILWFGAKDRTTTHAVITHREDKTGVRFGKDIISEITKNEVLRDHWPQYRDCPELSKTQITINRPPGIREPFFALFGILSSAASGHYTHHWYDDVVSPEEHSPVVLDEIDSRLSMAAFTGHDDTLKVFIGVPSCEQDPVERRRKKGGFFKKVIRRPGIEPGNVYPLRSKKYYDQLRIEVREDHFASQVLLQIVPPGMVYFRKEWLRRYTSTPERAAEGCRISIKIDPAEGKKVGKKKLSDFLVIEVQAFTYDKRRRSLDLWRERIGMSEAIDLLLGPLPGEEEEPENQWKIDKVGKRGLVGKWQRIDPHLSVYVENVGASGFDATIRKEMRFRKTHDPRSPSCTVRELRSQVKKEDRIAAMQPDLRNGILEFPLNGYGHGSYTTDDERDTMEQFIEDEYKLWTLAGDVLNDDVLDLMAWPSQPGAQFAYPEMPAHLRMAELMPMTSYSSSVSSGRSSWRVS